MALRPGRVNLTLSEELVSELQQWADQCGHTVTSLCAWLVKKSLLDAKKSGDFKSGESDAIDLMRQFFDEVAAGKFYTDKNLIKLAMKLDISVDHLIAYQNCFKKQGKEVAK